MTTAPLIALLITVLVAFVTLNNWRYGLLCIIAIGVLQDVLRKLTPDVPSYYIVWSMVIFGGVALVAVSRNAVGSLRVLWFGDRKLKGAFYLYFLVISLHLVHSFIRWGEPVIPVFGLIFYFGPILALLVVQAFAREQRWMARFINTYLIVMVPVCLTVYLSPAFKESIPILRDVGSFLGRELIIYDVGTILYSYPGLLRVGELAAFHAATCTALLASLLYHRNVTLFRRIAYIALMVALVGAIVLTGRRKMLMALSIFLVLQFFLLNVLRSGVTRRLLLVLLLGSSAAAGFGFMSQGESSSLYLERGATVFGDVGQRADMSVMLFQSAMGRSSWLGLGAGTASQGMRYSGADMSLYVGGSNESGIGYLAVELGLPGVLAIAWLIFNLARVLWRQLQRVARINDSNLVEAVSYTALLVANMATFATATQLYGDYFVLIILGVFAGGLYGAIYDARKKQLLLLRYAMLQQRYQMPAAS